jgi:outer membrane protein assembly factor BamB
MKNKTIIIMALIVSALLLTACTGSGTAVNSWAGASMDETSVYFADGTMVYALRADNGNTIWSYPEKATPNRAFLAAPVAVGEQLIVGDFSGLITSLSTRDGQENWQFNGAEGRYIDSPVLVNETLVAPNADFHLYALNLDGELLWSFEAENSFWAQPVSDGTTVFAPSLDHYLYAVDVSTGKLAWKTDLTASLVSRPTLVDGILYVGNLDGGFFAIDSANGKILWQQKLAGGVWSAPVVTDFQVYISDQTGKLTMLEQANGSIVQSIEIGSAIVGSGVLTPDGIIFGTEAGELIMIGLDGKKAWTRTVDGSIYANLVSSGETIIVVATKGEKPLVAMDTNGNEIWYFATKK